VCSPMASWEIRRKNFLYPCFRESSGTKEDGAHVVTHSRTVLAFLLYGVPRGHTIQCTRSLTPAEAVRITHGSTPLLRLCIYSLLRIQKTTVI
jgi:hypothetical protein